MFVRQPCPCAYGGHIFILWEGINTILAEMRVLGCQHFPASTCVKIMFTDRLNISSVP